MLKIKTLFLTFLCFFIVGCNDKEIITFINQLPIENIEDNAMPLSNNAIQNTYLATWYNVTLSDASEFTIPVGTLNPTPALNPSFNDLDLINDGQPQILIKKTGIYNISWEYQIKSTQDSTLPLNSFVKIKLNGGVASAINTDLVSDSQFPVLSIVDNSIPASTILDVSGNSTVIGRIKAGNLLRFTAQLWGGFNNALGVPVNGITQVKIAHVIISRIP